MNGVFTKQIMTRFVSALMAILFSFIMVGQVAYAQTDIYKVLQYPFYDPDAVSVSCSSSSTLVGSGNVQKAFYYFTGKGLQDYQSAGIVGNLRQESGTGIDPTNVQLNGVGHGIAQWSEPGRWDTLLEFAASHSQDPTDLGLQLDFMWEELTNGYASTLSAIKKSTDYQQATSAFMNGYERPDARYANLTRRLKYAKQVLDKYGDTTVSSSSSGGCFGSEGATSIVQIALAEVGIHETGGENNGAPCKYQGTGCPEAWCADFISWVYKQAGVPFTGGADGGWRIAGAAALAEWFKANGTWIDNPGHTLPVNDPDAPQPGDVVYYAGGDGHINIVVSYDGKTVKTVGGNQSDAVNTDPHDVFGTADGWGRLK
jgi:hypothetical protein